MTVILGVIHNDKCYVGGDCCVSYNSFHYKCNTPKVFHYGNREDIVLAFSGSIRIGNLVYTDTEMFPSDVKASDIDLKYMIDNVLPIFSSYAKTIDDEWEVLVAVENRMFIIQGDLSIVEMSGSNDIVTLGSGCESAYGAISAFKSIYEYLPLNMSVDVLIGRALNIALEYNRGIPGDLIILHT